MLLATFSVLDDIINNRRFIIIIKLRKQDIFCAVGDTTPCNVACASSHNLYNTTTFMGCGCITYFINGFHRCIHCCIKTNCILCTGDIKVNRSWNTNCINAKCCKFSCTLERTISTNDNNTINTMFTANLSAFLLSFLRTEFRTARCIQKCTAAA